MGLSSPGNRGTFDFRLTQVGLVLERNSSEKLIRVDAVRHKGEEQTEDHEVGDTFFHGGRTIEIHGVRGPFTAPPFLDPVEVVLVGGTSRRG